MYKLYNWLFGWDYILQTSGMDCVICKVFYLPDGRLAYWEHKGLRWLKIIKTKNQVIWLTCDGSKYFPDNPKEQP